MAVRLLFPEYVGGARGGVMKAFVIILVILMFLCIALGIVLGMVIVMNQPELDEEIRLPEPSFPCNLPVCHNNYSSF